MITPTDWLTLATTAPKHYNRRDSCVCRGERHSPKKPMIHSQTAVVKKGPTVQFDLSIRRVTLTLVIIALLFVPLNYFLRWFETTEQYPIMDPYNFLVLLDVDGENTIPAWYSGLLLAGAAGLLALLGITSRQRQTGYTWAWNLLAVLFFVLSIDELTSIHERLMEPARGGLFKFGLYNSFLYFAWVVPAIIGLILLTIILFGFLRHLPRPVLRDFFVAGVVFLSGAIIVEIITGNIVYHGGITDRTFRMWQPVEEFLEMLGATLFIRALLMHLASQTASPGATAVDRLHVQLSGTAKADATISSQ